MNKKQILNWFKNTTVYEGDVEWGGSPAIEHVKVIFKPSKDFGHFSLASSINLLKPEAWDLSRALDSVCKDGWETIVIYLDEVKK